MSQDDVVRDTAGVRLKAIPEEKEVCRRMKVVVKRFSRHGDTVWCD